MVMDLARYCAQLTFLKQLFKVFFIECSLVQGGTCGFGMRGQKARSGSGVRHGFEGGQTPLYRQLPKLKGIAGGTLTHLLKHCRFPDHSLY